MRDALQYALRAVSMTACLVIAGCGHDIFGPYIVVPSSPGSLTGIVYSGKHPVSGAHVYVYAAGSSGYGQASVSLLKSVSTSAFPTGRDASGKYFVTTDTTGGFSLDGAYNCAAGTQVYLYAAGGSAGYGENSALVMLAVLGQCPSTGTFTDTVPYLWVNEVSTIVAAYVFAGFAGDATHVSSSGTALAHTGIANAFATASNLIDAATGVALTVTPAGNGAVPQTEIHTLANILAACNLSGNSASSECSQLFAQANGSGSSVQPPTETATAAIHIAHNPAQTTLFALQQDTLPPFQPYLTAPPNDFSIGLNFTGGGFAHPYGVVVDAAGSVWIGNIEGSNVVKVSSNGAFLSGAAGFTGANITHPQNLAVDLSGNVWVCESYSDSGLGYISELANDGTPLASYSNPYLLPAFGIAVDPEGNVWATEFFYNSIFKLTLSQNPPAFQEFTYAADDFGIAIDTKGNVWVPSSPYGVAEFTNDGIQFPNSPYQGVYFAYTLAIDHKGYVWAASTDITNVYKIPPDGAAGTTQTFTAPSLNYTEYVAIDGAGNAWLNGYLSSSLTEFSNDGVLLSPPDGFLGGGLDGPNQTAVDGSGNVWVGNHHNNSLSEFIGIATPVVTPLVYGVANDLLGTRP